MKKMRQIKFRVFHDGTMYYTDRGNTYLAIFGGEKQIPWGLYDQRHGNRLVTGDPKAIFNSHGVLMEWSGVVDKNGKDIYEGDIVHQSGYAKGFNHQVVFYDSRFCLMYDGIHTDYIPALIVEVIGNIYENPKLIIQSQGNALLPKPARKSAKP